MNEILESLRLLGKAEAIVWKQSNASDEATICLDESMPARRNSKTAGHCGVKSDKRPPPKYTHIAATADQVAITMGRPVEELLEVPHSHLPASLPTTLRNHNWKRFYNRGSELGISINF